jgi:hypothetical protein
LRRYIGLIVGVALILALYPGAGERADDVVVPQQQLSDK